MSVGRPRSLPRGVVVLPILLLMAVVFPLLTDNPYYISTGAVALEFVALAVVFDLVAGRAGALTLAQPLFFGAGAYGAALLTGGGVSDFLVEALVIAGGCFALGVAIAIPAFRLSLHTFAMGTLGFAQIGALVATDWTEVTRGPLCLVGIPAPQFALLGGALLESLASQYYLMLGIAVATVLLVVYIESSGAALLITAVRESSRVASARGYWPLMTRIAVFASAGAVTGVVGVFDAHFHSVVCPSNLSFALTATLLIIVFVGGRASLRGILTAAVVFTILPQALRLADEWRLVLYGLALLVVIAVAPGGLEAIYSAGERAIPRWMRLVRREV